MRRCVYSKIRTSSSVMPNSCLKFIFLILLCYGLFYFLRHSYISSKTNVKARSIAESASFLSWHCELDKRMLAELQKELKEKDKLLHYRGKVIAKLRNQVHRVNTTNSMLKHTLSNLTDILTPRNNATDETSKQNRHSSDDVDFASTSKQDVPFPEDIKDKVDRAARPCCIALKRMTDILRVYMETTRDLRDQVAAYQRFNFTERMYQFAEREKRKFAALNCSERFKLENSNLTKKPEKHALYQTYSYGYFYETTPLNRVEPKQRFKSRSYHRNIDFAKAVNVALQEILRETKLSRTLFEMNDALIRYDELKGAEYKLAFLYNKSRSFSVDLFKPFGPHILANRIAEQTIEGIQLINIIVPITGRTDRLNIYLENIHLATVVYRENIFLTVVIYGADPKNEIKNAIKKFSKINNFKNYDILKRNVPFNRGRALHDGIMRWNGYKNVLMFLCDIDIKFKPAFLSRCRKHAQLGKSVYMPVVFSLYNPEVVFERNMSYSSEQAMNISVNTGTWRPLGYGMLCAYKPDYLAARGFNLKINGWGGEDVSLYHRFLKKGIKIIRAPDPDLFHVWHQKLCSHRLSKRQYETCIGSKARYEGSQRQLGILLLSKNHSSRLP